jgi:hypothetical protein
MLGERMKLERVTIRGRRENDCWGSKGYKYPQIQNSNGHISKSEPPRKSRNLQPLKPLLTVARTVETSEINLGTSEHRNNRGKTAADISPQGMGLGLG